MSTLSATERGEGRVLAIIDHDPNVTDTDLLLGSIIVVNNPALSNVHGTNSVKRDNGPSTNIVTLFDFNGLRCNTFSIASGDTLLIDNTSVTGNTFLDLGTNTNDTSVQVRDNSGTPLLFIGGDGNVGINTITPGILFDGTKGGSYDKLLHVKNFAVSGSMGMVAESETNSFMDLISTAHLDNNEHIFGFRQQTRFFTLLSKNDDLTDRHIYWEFNRGVNQFRRSFGFGIRTVTDSDDPYSAATDDTIIIANNSSAMGISLITPFSGNNNVYMIKKIGMGNVNITGTAGYSENLTATGASLMVAWDGSAWQTIFD